MRHCFTKSNISYKTLAVLFFMAFALPFLSACKQEQQASQVKEDKRPVMRIAFVGDDFIRTSNLPYMIQLLAKDDPSSHFQLQVTSHTMVDASLAQLWKIDTKKTIFTPDSWDYVVLQPHSLWAATEGHVYLSQQSISVWARYVNSIQAQPVLFMTWPLDRNNTTYGDRKYASTLKNYKNMHRLIHGYSKAIAKKNDIMLTPIGDYWMHAMAIAPDIKLYSDNGYSPTIEGTYLTALIIYKTLVNGSLDKIVYMPQGMGQDTKDMLIAIASTKID